MDPQERIDVHFSIPVWKPRLLETLRVWIPNRGSVLFTLLVVGLFFFAQSAGAFGLTASNAPASSTGTIAYQGRLANKDGSPVTATLNMVFRLYSVQSGGTPLWEEQWTASNSVAVSDGLFNVMLGSITPVNQATLTGNSSLWLGISVGSDGEMTPRVQLGSVPYAFQALTVPDGAITTAKLTDGSVSTAKLADGSVTQSKLGTNISIVPPDDSISTAKIVNGSVTRAKLGPDAIIPLIQSGDVIADTSVTGWTLHLGSGYRTYQAHVTFPKGFSQIPVVITALRSIDDSPATGTRLTVFAQQITTTGFDMVVLTWADSIVYGTAATWIAYGNP